MRKIMMAAVLGALTISGCATAGAQTRAERGEAQLQKMLEGRVAGEPVSCITTMGRDRLRVIDETAVVYDGGRTIYVARPTDRRQLSRNDVLVIERTSGTQLCTMDIIRTIDRSTGFRTGAVFLEPFVPYTREAE